MFFKRWKEKKEIKKEQEQRKAAALRENKEIITLNTEDETYEFIVVYKDAYVNDKNYWILQPVVLLDGMDPDEALVFEATPVDDYGSFNYNVVTDEDIIEAVFTQYNKLFE